MEFIRAYTIEIEKEINQLNLPDQPSHLYDPLRYFMTLGGKRMRPILTLLGAEIFGAKSNVAMNAALAIEVFHNFSLIHDDIMDEAPLRRNQATVHTKWNSNIAILSGDVLLVKAYELIANQEKGDLRKMLQLFNKTAIEVCEGQQMDMDFEALDDVSIEQYTEMIRLKTSVLLGCALELGAIIAGASERNCQLIYDYGLNIGLAFQIHDDILDLYADPEKFGKQVGGDVISNKKTMLYLEALKLATSEQLKRAKALYYMTDQTLKVEGTRILFDEIGARSKCEEMIEFYYEKAKAAMDAIEVETKFKQPLTDLGDYLLVREH
jgi:geranylgeranyl diphosphate synthase type II